MICCNSEISLLHGNGQVKGCHFIHWDIFFFPKMHHCTDTLNSSCCFILRSLCFVRSFSSQPLPLVSWLSCYHVHTVSPQLRSLFNFVCKHLSSLGESLNSCVKPLVTSLIHCKSCPFTDFSFLNLN